MYVYIMHNGVHHNNKDSQFNDSNNEIVVVMRCY